MTKIRSTKVKIDGIKYIFLLSIITHLNIINRIFIVDFLLNTVTKYEYRLKKHKTAIVPGTRYIYHTSCMSHYMRSEYHNEL